MITEKETEYFNATRPLVKMEVALVKHIVEHASALTTPEENTIRYAVNLGRMGPFRAPSGKDLKLFEELTPFRKKVIGLLSSAMGSSLDEPDSVALVRLAPQLQEEILIARHILLENHINDFNEDHLDKEICRKALVSVAGGGGGAGMVYVGAYKLLEDHGIKPAYVVGTSIGAIIGSLRVFFTDFDLAKLGREISRAGITLTDLFMIRPPSTQRRYGLPAAVRLDLYPTAEKLFRGLGQDVPAFQDLPIPFHAVVCGIKRGGLRHDMDYYSESHSSAGLGKGLLKITPSTLKWIVRSLYAVARDFTNPDMLVEVVFGRDDPTQKCKTIDGVGFSCAIPGLLHYDIFRYDPDTTKYLDQLFDNYELACLVDGAAVNNVPSRVAWENVYRGIIGTRNVFILAFDSFSPRFNRNILFLPIQRLLQINVRANLKYSTYTKAFNEVPNPLHLIGRTKSMVRMFRRGISDLTPDLPFIHRMLKPICGPKERFGA